MEVSLYCVFVFLLKFSDLATLHFHFNASYYFVSNLSPGSKSDPVSFPLPSIHCRMERGEIQGFLFLDKSQFWRPGGMGHSDHLFRLLDSTDHRISYSDLSIL